MFCLCAWVSLIVEPVEYRRSIEGLSPPFFVCRHYSILFSFILALLPPFLPVFATGMTKKEGGENHNLPLFLSSFNCTGTLHEKIPNLLLCSTVQPIVPVQQCMQTLHLSIVQYYQHPSSNISYVMRAIKWLSCTWWAFTPFPPLHTVLHCDTDFMLLFPLCSPRGTIAARVWYSRMGCALRGGLRWASEERGLWLTCICRGTSRGSGSRGMTASRKGLSGAVLNRDNNTLWASLQYVIKAISPRLKRMWSSYVSNILYCNHIV